MPTPLGMPAPGAWCTIIVNDAGAVSTLCGGRALDFDVSHYVEVEYQGGRYRYRKNKGRWSKWTVARGPDRHFR
jgi:hypothetical protein